MYSWYITYRDGYGEFYTYSSQRKYLSKGIAAMGLMIALNSKIHKERVKILSVFKFGILGGE
jgi:hypothetical protein